MRFSNLDPAHRPHRPADIFRWGIIDPLRGKRRTAPPGPPAPRIAPDLEAIHEKSKRPRLTWIGHSSFLAGFGGRSVLIDPVFSGRIAVVCPRYGEPGLQPPDLPRLSAVLVSHSHYDHLDRASLTAVPRDVPAVTPLGLGRWFRRWNRRPVTELDWWESTEIDGLRVTLLPSRHWSRRGVFDVNRALWGGFVIESEGEAIYHAGDSAAFSGFAEIGRRFPGLSAAMLPIGGYAPPWFMEKQHMNPEQAGEAFLELGARTLVPMHWGTFQLTDEPISEPAERMRKWWKGNGERIDAKTLRIPAIGETIFLNKPQ